MEQSRKKRRGIVKSLREKIGDQQEKRKEIGEESKRQRRDIISYKMK